MLIRTPAGQVLAFSTWVSLKIFENSGQYELTKLTKADSVSFVRPKLGKFPKIDEPEVFPHCPRCGSYALYRKNHQGAHECETCQLRDISQEVARRVQ